MRHVLRLMTLSLGSLALLAMPGMAQPFPPRNQPNVPIPLQPLPPKAPNAAGEQPFPVGMPAGVAVDPDVPDLRGWLDGSLRNNDKSGPPLDPKMLADLLQKMRQNKEAGGEGPEGGNDPAAMENMLKNNPAFKNPEFLKSLEKMMGDKNFPNNMKEKLGAAGQDPKVVDKMPDLKEKLGGMLEKAKERNQQNNNAGNGQQGNPNPDPNAGQNQNPNQNPNPDPSRPDNAGNGAFGNQNGPKLDPVAQEWVMWMEKNLSNSPSGQKAVKEMIDALGKSNMKGFLDDIPQFKTGEWKQFNDWGKNNLGDGWKLKPPEWNLSGGGSPPNFGNGLNFGGAPSIGGIGGGGVSAEGATGGVSVLAVIIGIAGAAFLAYMLLKKWQDDKKSKAAMAEAARRAFELSQLRNRQELVDAFDTLTLVKLGDESRNWNHRVVTRSFAESAPVAALPAEELGQLYERARYSPPQDDLSAGELTTAERDLRVVAGGNT